LKNVTSQFPVVWADWQADQIPASRYVADHHVPFLLVVGLAVTVL
jgi:hypothetical protein